MQKITIICSDKETSNKIGADLMFKYGDLKFSSEEVAQNSTSTNTTKATIALAETYRDNFLTRSSLYNVMSGFIEFLKEQQ